MLAVIFYLLLVMVCTTAQFIVIECRLTRPGVKQGSRTLAEHITSAIHYLLNVLIDTSYLPLLVPHEGLKNKVTLVQGAGFGTEFYQPGLTIAQFPTIFRWSDLATVQCTTKSSSITKPVATKGSMHASSPARDFPKTSALDRDNWRQKSDSVENISQGTNGLLIETADYTSEALPTKFESNKKSRLCRYFQKVCSTLHHVQAMGLTCLGLLPLG